MKRTPIKVKTHAICKNTDCGIEFRKFNTTDKYCSLKCQVEDKGFPKDKKQKTITKVSKKRKSEKEIYDVLRIEVLTEAKFKCFIDGCKRTANTVEHLKGRKGFADDWARDNNISLYIDKRFLKACCLQHNLELENNSELSKKYQLSRIHQGNKI